MLSLTCQTAIKAVIFLASKYESGTRSGMKEIAAYIDASEHTVGKLLQTLVKHKVINSAKGPAGGFFLSREQFRQPIIQIVYAIDGREVFKACGLGLHKCSASHPCPIHHEYKVARDVAETLFQNKRVYQLCEPVNNGLAYLMG
ncbi:MAG TPA: Rrf2 family transcriptional regulator [Saprospiraceae bacterium]|nr:Rrf2 family transcriptional regulator [Saprospiraceae bacterium]